jgi:hypothetical protein
MRLSGKARAVVRVIPDHPYFNNSTAAYEAQVHRFPVLITGTSGFPMFTDYVLLKSGDMGIDSPDRHRERLSRAILGAAGTDSSAFHLIDSVPLPDGSHACIVRVDPPKLRPADARRIVNAIRATAGSWAGRFFRAAEGSTLEVQEYDSAQTASGRIRAIRLTMKRGEFGDFAFNSRGIPVSDVDIEIRDIVIDPVSVTERKKLDVFSMRGLWLKSFCIKAPDILAYLSQAPSRDVAIRRISMEEGVIAVDAALTRFDTPVELAVALLPAGDSNISFEFRRARVGWLPIPAWTLNLLTQSYNPILRGLESVPDVRLGAIHLEGDELRIGPMNEGS